MRKPIIPLFFLVAVTAWAVTATEQLKNIRQVVEIHRLRPQTGSAGHRVPQIDCLSWRLGVETNNIRDWKLVPSECENYVGHYMLGQQYKEDCELVADEAIKYASGVTLSGDGTEIWVFDIDETTLSNLPYYARSDVAFGAVPYNDTKFDEWVSEGKAPAIPASLRLYNTPDRDKDRSERDGSSVLPKIQSHRNHLASTPPAAHRSNRRRHHLRHRSTESDKSETK